MASWGSSRSRKNRVHALVRLRRQTARWLTSSKSWKAVVVVLLACLLLAHQCSPQVIPSRLAAEAGDNERHLSMHQPSNDNVERRSLQCILSGFKERFTLGEFKELIPTLVDKESKTLAIPQNVTFTSNELFSDKIRLEFSTEWDRRKDKPSIATVFWTSKLLGDRGWYARPEDIWQERAMRLETVFVSVQGHTYCISTERWHSMWTGTISPNVEQDGLLAFPLMSSWLGKASLGGSIRLCFRSTCISNRVACDRMVHPSFGFWNAAALFHSEPWRARAKLDHFRGIALIARRMDITFAAESHMKEGDC
eukprot:2401644-Amphidinium_carterae.1